VTVPEVACVAVSREASEWYVVRPYWCLIRMFTKENCIIGPEAGHTPEQLSSPSQVNTETNQTLTLMVTLESSIKLTWMILGCGRKLEYLVKTHKGTGRTSKPNTD